MIDRTGYLNDIDLREPPGLSSAPSGKGSRSICLSQSAEEQGSNCCQMAQNLQDHHSVSFGLSDPMHRELRCILVKISKPGSQVGQTLKAW